MITVTDCHARHEVSHDDEGKVFRPEFKCVQAGSLEGNSLFSNSDLPMSKESV